MGEIFSAYSPHQCGLIASLNLAPAIIPTQRASTYSTYDHVRIQIHMHSYIHNYALIYIYASIREIPQWHIQKVRGMLRRARYDLKT